MKKLALTLALLTVMTLTGCTGEKTPASQIQPESKTAEGLSEEEARAILTEEIDAKKYAIRLVNDQLVIDTASYYEFQVLEGETAIEPDLVVEKKSGEVSCYQKDGTLAAYSTFPLFNLPAADGVTVDWNGTFEYVKGKIHNTAQVTQKDDATLEFTLKATADGGTGELSGTAVIKKGEATAVFDDGKEFGITFTLKEDILTVAEEGGNSYADINVYFNGEYSRK